MGKASEQRALITGASGGIGLELAREFAKNGHPLVLAARSEDKLEALAAELNSAHGVDAIPIKADLADPQTAKRLVDALKERRLDIQILVNNAGVLEMGAFHDMTTDALLRIVQINVGSLTALCSYLVQPMVAGRFGRILNIASVAGFQPVPSLAAYAASKAFVLSLTESLAEELKGTGVTATAVCPGLTDTAMVQNATAGKSRGSALNAPRPFVLEPGAVAKEAYQACMRGDVLRVPGAAMKLVTGLIQAQRNAVRSLAGFAGRWSP